MESLSSNWPAVPGHDAEARRGPHRGTLAGDCHRAEDHLQESPVHGRDRAGVGIARGDVGTVSGKCRD